jgi:hypothetical protein
MAFSKRHSTSEEAVNAARAMQVLGEEGRGFRFQGARWEGQRVVQDLGRWASAVLN